MEITLRYGLALHLCSIKQQACKQITYCSDFCIYGFFFVCLFVFLVRSEHNLKSGSLRRFLTTSYLGGVNDACCNSEIGPISNGLLRFMARQEPKAPT